MMKYLNKEVKGHCPVCSSENGILRYEVNSLQSTRHFRPTHPSKEKYEKLKERIELLWGQESCQIVNCENCDFTYAFPYVGGDNSFYTLAYERSGYPTWKFEFQKSYDTLKKIKNKGDHLKVLEIGAGNGAFLSRISPEFVLPENVFATEYSEYGLKRLKKYGYNTINEDFRTFGKGRFDSFFDSVFLFQVLEHLDDIQGTFQTISSITKPGAFLFIGVPNSSRIEFNELNGALLDMPPNHIGRWTKKTFQFAADRFGWEIFDYEIEQPNLDETIEQFGLYKYLRNQQIKSSIENMIETYNHRLINNRFYSLKRIMLKLHKRTSKRKIKNAMNDLGNCQWVVFKKRITIE